MFQPTKEWVNKVNLSSFELENFFKFGACMISARKAKQLDATTMFTYSHANTALGQSERVYYLSYFINNTCAVYKCIQSVGVLFKCVAVPFNLLIRIELLLPKFLMKG